MWYGLGVNLWRDSEAAFLKKMFVSNLRVKFVEKDFWRLSEHGQIYFEEIEKRGHIWMEMGKGSVIYTTST